MRKRLLIAALICFAIAAFLSTGFTEEKDETFRDLQHTFSLVHYTDFATSYIAVSRGWAGELHPYFRWAFNYPVIAVGSHIAIDLGIRFATNRIYEWNRTAGYVMIIAGIVWRGYILAHNFKVLSR